MSERSHDKGREDVVDVDLGLPDRKYFKIGEVAELLGVETHVLRYWETQFSQLRPHKARSGHRLYRRREVETLLVIKDLLHVQRFTIAGARQALRQQGTSSLLPRAAEQLTLPPTGSLQARHTRVVESTIPTPAEDLRDLESEVEGDVVDDSELEDSELGDSELGDSELGDSVVDESALDGRPIRDDDDDDVDDDDEDDDDVDDVVELHLADPLPRPGAVPEVMIGVESLDDDALEEAMSAQLAEQLAGRDRQVSKVEVGAELPRALARHRTRLLGAQQALREAEVSLQQLLQTLPSRR